MVISQDYIKELKEKLEEYNEIKDNIINKSVKVSRLSKTIIYSLIRDDVKNAEEHIKEIKELVEELKSKLQEYPMFYSNISVGLQEYAEAMILYSYLTKGKIPTHKELGIDELSYIKGLIDFVGELSRKAIEEMTKDNLEFALKAKKEIEDIYLKMLYIEFKSYDLRRKVDYIANILNMLNEKIFYKSLFRHNFGN